MANTNIQAATARIRSRSWRGLDINRWTTGRSVSESVKSALVGAGYDCGYFAVTEVLVDPDSDSRERIDVAWLDTSEWEPVVGFEIGGGVPEGSVDKLGRFGDASPQDVEKVVVSKSPNKSYINQKREANLPDKDDWFHIDVRFYEHRD